MCESKNISQKEKVFFPVRIMKQIQGRVVRSTLPQWLGILTSAQNDLGSGNTEAAELDVDVPGEDR